MSCLLNPRLTRAAFKMNHHPRCGLKPSRATETCLLARLVDLSMHDKFVGRTKLLVASITSIVMLDTMLAVVVNLDITMVTVTVSVGHMRHEVLLAAFVELAYGADPVIW